MTIQRKKVRSSLMYQADPPNAGRVESNYSPSEAVPDQSLTVRELLRRHGAGTLQDIAHADVFYNEDMPDMRGLDIVEKHRMLEDVKSHKNQILSEESQRAKKKREALPLPPLPDGPKISES